MLAVIDGRIVMKDQLGDDAQTQLFADFTPDKRDGTLEAGCGVTTGLFITDYREKDLGQGKIRGHVDGGDGDKADPGILHPFDNQGRDLFLDRFSDLLCPLYSQAYKPLPIIKKLRLHSATDRHITESF